MTSRPSHECREMELSLGVLVLGALEPAERPSVEAHLAHCSRCTAILAELAPLPGLLHRLDPVEHAMPASTHSSVSPPPEPQPLLEPTELRDRLVEAARAAGKRQRSRWALGISAAAILLGVVLAGTLPGLPWNDDQRPAATVASATDPGTAVRAVVRLTSDSSGTALALRLTGVAPEEHCRLVAVDADGHQLIAASWVATYEGHAAVTGHTSLQQHEIKRLLVVTDAGRMLVKVPVNT